MDDWGDALGSLFFELGQEWSISKLQDDVHTLRCWKAGVVDDVNVIQDIAERNVETNLRLALLVRLLISKGVTSAEEFATLISDFRRSTLDSAENSATQLT